MIAHRGNTDGPNPQMENDPEYVMDAINNGYDVEVDLWSTDTELFLGHDEPKYKIDKEFLETHKDKLWIHCKNSEAMEFFATSRPHFNFFWHQKDDFTLTSFGYIWVYPGINPTAGSILVLPENTPVGQKASTYF